MLFRDLKGPDAWLFKCLDCEYACLDDFVVHDTLWRQAVPEQSALHREARQLGVRRTVRLHLSCFEKRLGREVTVKDLKDVPANKLLRLFWERGCEKGRTDETHQHAT